MNWLRACSRRSRRHLTYFFENILLVKFWVSEIGVLCSSRESESTVRSRYVCEGVFVFGGICWFRRCFSQRDEVFFSVDLIHFWGRTIFHEFPFSGSYVNRFAHLGFTIAVVMICLSLCSNVSTGFGIPRSQQFCYESGIWCLRDKSTGLPSWRLARVCP